MEKKIPVKTLYLLSVISFGLIFLGLGSTYAIFTASAEITNPIRLSSNLTYNSDILETVNLTVEAGETVATTLNITNSTTDTLNYITWYTASSSRYISVGVEETSSTPTGSLESSGSASVIVVVRNSGTSSISINIGVSSSNESVVLGTSMKAVPNEKLPDPPINLITHITNLYNENVDEENPVSNNNIAYNYAKIYDNDTDDTTSGGLMNDRHNNAGNLLDDANAGNIRYYGASPNNYVDIGDRDSSGNVILWRIIGLFKNIELKDGTTKNLVKIIRNDTIGYYSWDNKANGIGSSLSNNGSNDWSDSRLMMVLNPGYEEASNIYSYVGSLYYNSNSGTCYKGAGTTTCNFTSNGLSSNARDKIEEVVWNLGGHSTYNIYSDQIYGFERGTTTFENSRATSFEGKVALMYASDYGYATDFNYCSGYLYKYYTNSDCYKKDWLYLNITQWTLTPQSDISSYVFNVDSLGFLTFTDANYVAGIRPTVYINSELDIVSGTGTSSNPYVLE